MSEDPLEKVPRTRAIVDRQKAELDAITPNTPRERVLRMVHEHLTELAVHAMKLEMELDEAKRRRTSR